MSNNARVTTVIASSIRITAPMNIVTVVSLHDSSHDLYAVIFYKNETGGTIPFKICKFILKYSKSTNDTNGEVEKKFGGNPVYDVTP